MGTPLPGFLQSKHSGAPTSRAKSRSKRPTRSGSLKPSTTRWPGYSPTVRTNEQRHRPSHLRQSLWPRLHPRPSHHQLLHQRRNPPQLLHQRLLGQSIREHSVPGRGRSVSRRLGSPWCAAPPRPILACGGGRRNLLLMEDLDSLDVPNCPQCLESMQPVVGAWWCETCRVTVRSGE